jgi:hypothetical protein
MAIYSKDTNKVEERGRRTLVILEVLFCSKYSLDFAPLAYRVLLMATGLNGECYYLM